jgi:cation diffusion facilitator CzcD-associated flavoprotein CzcO
MTIAHPSGMSSDVATRHVDVLVVGAGISGIGGAVHLRRDCPELSVVILENQASYGGTWRTHTYPGVRSDSDLHTFGYGFKPWRDKPIATADKILSYLGEVIDEYELAPLIHYHHAIEHATWSSDDARWTVSGRRTDTDEPFEFTTSFLYMCQGYYRHARGHQPTWPGTERFGGTIVHPQTWPDDLDYHGKRVVVIGSGATAATIIPAMAPDVEHITMLQRSPTYFRPSRNRIELAEQLRELEAPEEWVHELVRRRMLVDSSKFTDLCFSDPEAAKRQLFDNVRDHLDPEHHHLIEEHFTPRYLPWRERIAIVPDGDLFQAINSGKASVVTDHIESFTETGIQLASGEHLDADIVITATGFELNVLGDIEFEIDGAPLDFHETVTYHGAMFTGIPNMVWVFGYFRASWTLRADLIAEFVVRLLHHMRAKGADVVVPRLRPGEEDMPRLPWIDPENFNPGYLRRGLHLLPQQGDRDPWLHRQDYWRERDVLATWDLDDGALEFT